VHRRLRGILCTILFSLNLASLSGAREPWAQPQQPVLILISLDIPGIRPGKRTQTYINTVVNRITLVGALFLGTIAVLPGLMQVIIGLVYGSATAAAAGGSAAFTTNPANVIGPSGLIIVVGVVIDTMRQLEAQLMMRNYSGFLR
jgi:preprotein translocase subunit SecY